MCLTTPKIFLTTPTFASKKFGVVKNHLGVVTHNLGVVQCFFFFGPIHMGVVMTKALVFVSFWELSDRYTYSLVNGLLLSFRSIYSDNGTIRFFPCEWSYFTCFALQRETGPPHILVGDHHVVLHIFSCPVIVSYMSWSCLDMVWLSLSASCLPLSCLCVSSYGPCLHMVWSSLA